MKEILRLAVLVCAFTIPLQGTVPDLISAIEVDRNRLTVVPNPDFKRAFLRDDFRITYEYGINLERLPSHAVIMPFLLNVISMVWVSGDKYSVKEMDSDLFYSLQKVKEVFKRLYPRTKFDGEVIAKKLIKNDKPVRGRINPWKDHVVHFFTGGLDSTYTSLRHGNDKQLLVTVFRMASKDRFIRDTHNQVTRFAKKFGHSSTAILSNFEDFFNRDVLHNISPDIKHWRLDLVEGLGWIGMAIPIMLSRGITQLRIASSLAWSCKHHHAPMPHIDENVRFSDLKFEHDGFDASRINKCEFLGNFCRTNPGFYPILRVCKRRQRGANCSQCEKCLRTIANLRAVGEDHRRYGFKGAPSSFRSYAQQRYSTMVMTRYNLWHYLCTQAKIREMKETPGFLLDPYLAYVEQFDFEALNRDKDAGMYEMNWDDFTDLLPERRK